MTEPVRNSLIGLFVIGALCVFGGLMVMFGETPSWLFTNHWELVIAGPQEIRGIGDGTPVYLNGLEIGRVKRLEFRDPEQPGLGVKVIANIENAYAVPSGAVAKMYGATLGFGAGQIHIVVEPSREVQLLRKDRAYIRGEMASLFGEIITEEMTQSVQRAVDNIGAFAGEGVPVARNLADLLEHRSIAEVTTRGDMPNVSTVVERIDSFIANLNTVLGDTNVQGDVKAIASGLKEAAEKAKELVELWRQETENVADNVNRGIDRTDDNLNEALTKLIGVVENLDTSTKELTDILEGISSGEGTAGLLVRDDRLYEAGVLALQRLADTIASIRRITSKIEEDGYITIAQETAVGTFTKDFPVGPKDQVKASEGK
jgi:ABC-type transporter Mla subunit MlaD